MNGDPKRKPNALFAAEEMDTWAKEWKGMPEFVQPNIGPFKSLLVHFETEADFRRFGEVLGIRLTLETRSAWYPEAAICRMSTALYVDDDAVLSELEEIDTGVVDES